MNEKAPQSRLEHWALIRHSAVTWIEQSLNQGNILGRALALALELAWSGRRYSPRTLASTTAQHQAKISEHCSTARRGRIRSAASTPYCSVRH
jgi:hypothetical protein